MRKLKKIGVFLFVFVTTFISGVYFEKLMDSFYPHENDNYMKMEAENDLQYEEILYSPAIQSEELISADTKLIIVEHDLKTGNEIRGENAMPTKYIGLDRVQFVEEMELYEISPALSDIKKGFKSLLVLSFSSKEVILQKNYMANDVKTHFYMISKDNKVVVYYEDMKTLFLTTEIEVDQLPENVRLEILNKKYFETEEELYNFLESYSS